jgi:hypothetical protein
MLFNCPICFEAYHATREDGARAPVVASCGHTFCLGCARRLRLCAICRSPIRGEALPKNYQLLEALESVPPPVTNSQNNGTATIPPGDLTLSSTVLGVGGTGKVVLGTYKGRQVGVFVVIVVYPASVTHMPPVYGGASP